MKKILKKILNPFAGRTFSQFSFELIYKLGLYGMNIGGSSDIKINGEKKALEYIRENIPTVKPVIFDVGANVGDYTEALKQAFDQSEIHAFEPLESNYKVLKKKFKEDREIHLVKSGIGEKRGKLTMYYNPELGSMASLYERQLDHHHFEINDSKEVEIETLDNYCTDHKLESIDFLKLDIEGHELAALKGAQKLLDGGKIHFIQFEFGGTNIDSRTFFRDFWYLLTPRYRMYRILKNGLKEITSYSENNEIFGYINYLAVLKNKL